MRGGRGRAGARRCRGRRGRHGSAEFRSGCCGHQGRSGPRSSRLARGELPTLHADLRVARESAGSKRPETRSLGDHRVADARAVGGSISATGGAKLTELTRGSLGTSLQGEETSLLARRGSKRPPGSKPPYRLAHLHLSVCAGLGPRYIGGKSVWAVGRSGG